MAGNAAVAANRRSSSAPTTLYLLILTSIAIGISVHLTGIQSGPQAALPKLALLTPVQLRQQVFGAGFKTASKFTAQHSLGLDPSTALAQRFDAAADFALRILLYFRDHTVATRLGKALLLALTGYILPLSSFMTTEPLKPTRNAFTGILYAIFVLSVGQIIMIGAAAPILFVPYYALKRISEVSSALRLSSSTEPQLIPIPRRHASYHKASTRSPHQTQQP